MYWMKYAGKSLRGNWKSYLIFGVFLTIVFAAWSIVSVFSEKTQASLEDLEREYGQSYILQDNGGTLLTKELYEQLRDCPYVADIEYRKCQHFVYPANLTLARNGAAIVLDDLLLVNGFAGFPEDTPLVSGVLPAQPDECVVESSQLPDCALGDTLSVADEATHTAQTYRVVGLLDQDTCETLLGSDAFSGAVLFTTLDGALALEASGQTRTVISPGFTQGLDARIILNDYHDGEAFRQYVQDLRLDGRSLSALNPNEAYSNALNQLDDMMKMTTLLQRALMAAGVLAVLLLVFVRTNLRAKEICILVSMGFGCGPFLGAATLEYTATAGAAMLLGLLAGRVTEVVQGIPHTAQAGWYLPILLLLCSVLSICTAAWAYKHTPMRILRRRNEHD